MVEILCALISATMAVIAYFIFVFEAVTYSVIKHERTGVYEVIAYIGVESRYVDFRDPEVLEKVKCEIEKCLPRDVLGLSKLEYEAYAWGSSTNPLLFSFELSQEMVDTKKYRNVLNNIWNGLRSGELRDTVTCSNRIDDTSTTYNLSYFNKKKVAFSGFDVIDVGHLTLWETGVKLKDLLGKSRKPEGFHGED